MDRMRNTMERFGGPWAALSGNNAFDDYRTETLRRLEDEEKEFGSSSTACAPPRTSRVRSVHGGPAQPGRHDTQSPQS
jgi:hypothetical protein